MKIFAQWLLVFILAAILLVYVQGKTADKQTSRLYARAHLSEVQNEGRKDLMVGLIPYTVIAVSLIVGAIVVVVLTFGLIVIAAIWLDRPRAEKHVIERHVVVFLRDGQSRSDYYRRLKKIDSQTFFKEKA